MENLEDERRRAEVFDALAHPIRIAILKCLHEEPLSFSDLKRKMDIDSSGHLQHHLSKLAFLTRVNEEGNYQLSDQGKDALFTVETVERTSRPHAKEKVSLIRGYGSRARFALTLAVCFLVALSLVSGLYISNIEQPVTYTSTKIQYFYQELDGGLLEPSWFVGGPFQISPGQTFECTNFVKPKLEWHLYENISLVETEIPPPVSNDTFQRFCYAVFKISINTSLRWHASFVIQGPDGSEWPEVINYHSRIPPYETHRSRESMEVSAHAMDGFYKIAPISTYGNYTLLITNLGDSTIDGMIWVWSSQETIIVRSFDEDVEVTSRDIITIHSVPTTIEEQKLVKPFHLWGIAISGASTVTLAVLSVVLVSIRPKNTATPPTSSTNIQNTKSKRNALET